MKAVIWTIAACGLVAACGDPTPRVSTPRSHDLAGRKCPDLDNRDIHDPCSVSYLPPSKPRFKRDSL